MSLDFEGFLFKKGDLFSRNLLFRELKENFCQALERISFTLRSFWICGKNIVRIEFFFVKIIIDLFTLSIKIKFELSRMQLTSYDKILVSTIYVYIYIYKKDKELLCLEIDIPMVVMFET